LRQRVGQRTAQHRAFGRRLHARTQGWPDKDLNLVVHAAWSVEHGLATLIIADRVPRFDRKIDVRQMIRFSISLLLTGVAAGPAHFARVARLTDRIA
jgi:hypothetical protein